eukprot:331790-Chlamydomonas_euryale.AAC.1
MQDKARLLEELVTTGGELSSAKKEVAAGAEKLAQGRRGSGVCLGATRRAGARWRSRGLGARWRRCGLGARWPRCGLGARWRRCGLGARWR